MKDIVIVAGKRTPMGEYGGALRDFTALELGALRRKLRLINRSSMPATSITRSFGNALQTSGDAFMAPVTWRLKQGCRSRCRH